MKKKNIAVIFGGNSSEYEVSLQSASSVMENINGEKYEILPIGISRSGKWFHYTGEMKKIAKDEWLEDIENLKEVSVSLNPCNKGFLEFDKDKINIISIDLVIPILHGKNGEDGTLQGMFELAQIPVAGCDTLSSALCMDKDKAHKIVSLENIKVPKSITFNEINKDKAIRQIEEELDFPVFVKPVRAGSSFGITKVLGKDELENAINLALEHDNLVIVEENIEGFEVGCGILGIDELIVGRVDEIELSSGFFDYTEKYTLKTSKIHMPARIDAKTEKRIQDTAVKIYRALGCKGFARVDMFYTKEGQIVFNEVNTIPGFTSHSRFPNMMKGAGLSFEETIEKLIDLYLK
ncbi:D-alanine---D-serine ligase [Acetitomaculum ruminis DSM 5522]|uniref:D-alanine--D-alanine ligase n=1 Tax=Acetitomaculum ruminis DSM 5522 TaxID=1120918 RepID=A0A1I0ZT96_9FIRM|nr:D-alanine--D-serine ligase VanG [Acetitomaculum ruminis]SFB28737.1 D-alanine---D-serine ligase [Acetitomaculum ruminis DSM 5522]